MQGNSKQQHKNYKGHVKKENIRSKQDSVTGLKALFAVQCQLET